MKKLKIAISLLSLVILTLFSVNLKSQSRVTDDGLGKKCKNDERCWNGNTVECDEFGDGFNCVCYTC